MEKKRVSMREIAKVCGCSLATVSYALNHSGQGKLSHETRLRIIATAKKMNYSPARTTQAQKNRAAILIMRLPQETLGRTVALSDLALKLEEELSALGIPSVILHVEDLVTDWRRILSTNPTVVFVLDGNSSAVAHVNPPCVIPILFVDCDSSDPLYYKILPDYPSLFRQAREQLGEEHPFLVFEPVRCGQLAVLLTQEMEESCVYQTNSGETLEAFLQRHTHRGGIVVGDLLGQKVCGLHPPERVAVITALDEPTLIPPQAHILSVPNRLRARTAATVAHQLLTLDYDPSGANRILVESNVCC